MPERRYDDDEIAAIFARASEAEPEAPRRLRSGEGRTLSESAGSIALMGVALFGIGAARVPGWARLRRRQMEQLSERLTQLP
jgi:hypothetical protein